MNKVGFLAAMLMLPFLAFRYLPMGHATVPLDWFVDGEVLIGVFGQSIGMYAGNHVVPWWFMSFDVAAVVAGVVFWFFPVLSFIICLGGVGKAPGAGKKLYMAAFSLQFFGVLLLFIDGLVLGTMVMERVYPIVEFVFALQTGFWIWTFTMLVTVLAATTYKES